MDLKAKLEAKIKEAEARMAEIDKSISVSDDVKELKALQIERNKKVDEIAELRDMIAAIPVEQPGTEGGEGQDPGHEQRGATPIGATRILGTYGIGQGQLSPQAQRTKEEEEAAEKRGKDLLEKRSVTVASTGILVPTQQATDIRPTFNEVSGLIDRVGQKTLIGGESFEQSYISGYGTGDYKAEEAEYATAEPTFGYAAINKSKVTAYAEDTEELQKLPAAAYDAEVVKGITVAARKKITREILVGTGATNHLAGIFSAAATAIDAATDIEFSEIDETTLDEIIYSFGGDEDVEDTAVLILNKLDLKAFASLRSSDGKRIYNVVSRGNTGTIDGVPFIINSACEAVSDSGASSGDYCMAYGPLSNYMLVIFSDMDVRRSEDYKFKQGMIAHRGSIFAGGNVISKNGFLRVKKA